MNKLIEYNFNKLNKAFERRNDEYINFIQILKIYNTTKSKYGH